MITSVGMIHLMCKFQQIAAWYQPLMMNNDNKFIFTPETWRPSVWHSIHPIAAEILQPGPAGVVEVHQHLHPSATLPVVGLII